MSAVTITRADDIVKITFGDWIDREEIERLASSIERDTGRLLELMSNRQTREIVLDQMYWLAISEMRLATIREDAAREQ